MDSTNLRAQLDQQASVLRDFAPCIAAYYKGMVEAGIPLDLAAELVASWHTMQWAKWLQLSLTED